MASKKLKNKEYLNKYYKNDIKKTKTEIVVFEMHMLWRGQKQFIAMAHTDKQTDSQTE